MFFCCSTILYKPKSPKVQLKHIQFSGLLLLGWPTRLRIDFTSLFLQIEEEKDSIEIDVQDIMSSMENCEVSLLEKVIGDKQVSMLGVKNTMYLVWRSPVGLKVLLVGKNLFQFVFRYKNDMKKVLYGTPWLYDKYFLNIHQWQPELHTNSHIFNICEIWFQVWNIPLHWISYEVGSKIRHALGGDI